MSIFRSSGCVLLHVVFSTRCCGCGPKEPVCSVVHCVWVCIRRSRIQTHKQCTRLHTGSLGPQPQHLVLNTTCSSALPNSWRWIYRCPKHVDLFMTINHKCCIKSNNFFDCLTLEDGTNRSSRNFSNYQSMLRNIPEERVSQVQTKVLHKYVTLQFDRYTLHA